MAKEMGKPVVIIDSENMQSAILDLYDSLWDEMVRNRPKDEDDDEGFLF
jgi:hypothetical protein